jgi:hypothetical protein
VVRPLWKGIVKALKLILKWGAGHGNDLQRGFEWVSRGKHERQLGQGLCILAFCPYINRA